MTDISLNSEKQRYPYGSSSLDPRTREMYVPFALSKDCPLPDIVPTHHPVLQTLEGIYPVVDTLPPWWTDFVSQADERLRPLLQPLTIREFRNGCIDDERWRNWRNCIEKEAGLPSSPKLGSMIQGTSWRDFFECRGNKSTAEELDLVISSKPDYLLNMSNGDGWTSCQHLTGGYNEQLPGNLYDTGVVVAMLLPRNTDIWQGSQSQRKGCVLTRTTLRVFNSKQSGANPLVAIGQIYSNNQTLDILLLQLLIQQFLADNISWGAIVSTYSDYLIGSPAMGLRFRQEEEQHRRTAPPCWFPQSWPRPYLDGEQLWNPLEAQWYELNAIICRYVDAQPSLQ